MPNKEKPQLGLTPKYIWDNDRLQDIKAAVRRYLEANSRIPVEWITEYNNLVSKS